MLGIDYQRGDIGTVEPGADSGILEGGGGCEGQKREEVYRWE